jgi:hypothetical protein
MDAPSDKPDDPDVRKRMQEYARRCESADYYQLEYMKNVILAVGKTYVQLQEDLSRVLPYQPIAVNRIASLLNTLVGPSEDRRLHNDVRDRIHIRSLIGPANCGQLDCIKLLRRYLGMQSGDTYENQYVLLKGAMLQEERDICRINGLGANALGRSCMTCLVDVLCEQTKPTLPALPPPPFMLMHISEADLIHPVIRVELNRLLTEGTMKSRISGRLFTLPVSTQLICVYQSDYGAEQIGCMVTHDMSKATHCFYSALRANSGPGSGASFDTEKTREQQYGQLVAFFPASRNEMANMVRSQFVAFMNSKQSITQRYGAIDCSDAINCVVDFVLSLSDNMCNMKNSMDQFYDFITTLLLDATARHDVIGEGIAAATAIATKSATGANGTVPVSHNALKLFHEQFYLEDLNLGSMDNKTDVELRERLTKIINVIYRDQENCKKLEIYRKVAPQTAINALGISCNERIINCMIVPCLTINLYDSTQSAQTISRLEDQVQVLQAENEELKVVVNEIIRVLNDGQGNPLAITSDAQQLLQPYQQRQQRQHQQQQQQLLLSAPEVEEAVAAQEDMPVEQQQQQRQNKRKTPPQSKKEAGSKKKRGRPTLIKAGFVREGSRSKQAIMRCLRCEMRLYSKDTDKHVCLQEPVAQNFY